MPEPVIKAVWTEIPMELCDAIFKNFEDKLMVHACFTDSDGHHPLGNGKPQHFTEWGFSDSDFPLIKCVMKNGESHHYIREIKRVEEGKP